MAEPKNIHAVQLQVGAELPPEKRYYFNGFTVAMSPMDCAIVLLHQDRPIAFLNTSHMVAKTLVAALDTLIKDFEEKSGQQILKLDELPATLRRDVS